MAATPTGKVPAEYVPDLVIAQRLLTEGADAVSRADPISVRLGLIVTDLAAESVLKLVLRHSGNKIDLKSAFPKLVEAVIGKAEESAFGYVTGLTALRNTRNCVMHDGTGQDPQAARALVARTRDILLRLTTDVLAVDLANLHVAQFITSKHLRYVLIEAEKRHASASYCESAGMAVCAYDYLISRWGRFAASLAERAAGRVETPDAIIAAVSAGVHIPDLRRFRDATRDVTSMMTVSGKFQTVEYGWSRSRTTDQQREDSRLALDFVNGLALQIEGRMVGYNEPPNPYDDNLPET